MFSGSGTSWPGPLRFPHPPGSAAIDAAACDRVDGIARPGVARRLRAAVLFLAVLAPVAVPATGSESPRAAPATIAGARSFVYRAPPGAPLRLHVFDAAPAAAADVWHPAIVFFHGSGWESGSVTQFAGYARLLAGHGLVAALADYRTRDSHGAGPADAVDDAAAALRWMADQAGMLRIDPRRIIAAGASSGGHIALAATQGLRAEGAEEAAAAPAMLPAALILFATVFDTSPRGYSGDLSIFDAKSAALSPQRHVAAGLPPMLILHGSADRWVPVESVRRFAAAAAAAGNAVEYVPFAGRGHHFFNHPDYIGERPRLADRADPADFVAAFMLLQQFLRRYGYIGGYPEVISLPAP